MQDKVNLVNDLRKTGITVNKACKQAGITAANYQYHNAKDKPKNKRKYVKKPAKFTELALKSGVNLQVTLGGKDVTEWFLSKVLSQ